MSIYLYNITYNIEEKAHVQWLDWMQKTHIPEVLANSPFSHAKMIQVLIEEEWGGYTYSVQYQVDKKEYLDLFLNESSYNLFAEMHRMFPNQFVTFSTELKVIQEFTKQ